MQAITFESAINRLQRQPMLALPALKHTLMLGERASYFEVGDLTVVRFSPDQTPWDRSDYPAALSIHLLTGGTEANLLAYLATLSPGVHITKLNAALPRSANITRIKAFTSLTTDRYASCVHGLNVKVANQAGGDLEELLDHVHYTALEINQLMGADGRIFIATEGGLAVGCAVAYPNHGSVWEVGAVATLPKVRGRGVAKALVGEVTKYVLTNHRIPRYHVNQTNVASLQLAARCGYVPFMDYFHFQVTA